jgi:hypothetical protein
MKAGRLQREDVTRLGVSVGLRRPSYFSWSLWCGCKPPESEVGDEEHNIARDMAARAILREVKAIVNRHQGPGGGRYHFFDVKVGGRRLALVADLAESDAVCVLTESEAIDQGLLDF